MDLRSPLPAHGCTTAPVCLTSGFARPPAAYRGKPFWSWNGKLERDELLRQLGVASAMGMGGVFMHSRTGLQTAYLGDEWFSLINTCADESSARGLEAWLYDEDRWPSGSAGGLVTRDDITSRMRSMVLHRFEPGETVVWPAAADLLGAYLARLCGLDLLDYQPVVPGSFTTCPPDATLLLIVREIHAPHSFYNNGTYLDTLAPAATQRFLKITHEAYRKACGPRFGRAITGIFTDEPHRGFIFCDAVAQHGASDPGCSTPYTEALFPEFLTRFGYDLAPRLPELFFHRSGLPLSPLKWHYVELLQQLFLENWARPSHDWCRRHGLLLTGHVLHEDSLAAQVVPCGSLARYYEHMDYPGIDVLFLENRSYWVAKQVVSVARQLGKPFVLSELYGCTGWQLDFDGHKEIGDWQAVLGINLRCHHLSWFTMAGEAKRDYPASIFHQSSWYREYKYVEDYYARLHFALSRGEPDCDVLVLHPGESLWAQIHVGWATWLRAMSAPVLALEKKFSQLFHWLAGDQLDFDYGDEEQLSRLAAVESGPDGPVLRFGHMRYRVVVVGGLETLRSSSLDLLDAFIAAGGAVVFAGDAPAHADAAPSVAPRLLSERATRTLWERESLLAAVRPCSRQALRVEGDQARAAPLLAQVRRLTGGEWLIALVNPTRMPLGLLQLSFAASGRVEEWSCRSGDTRPHSASQTREGLIWTAEFGPLAERLFFVTPAASVEKMPASTPIAPVFVTELEGPFAYELSEPNVCVLDRATCRLGDGPSRTDDILRLDQALRDGLGWPRRSGEMVQPWCRTGSPASTEQMLDLRFAFDVSEVPLAIDLLLEQPERWSVRLNSTPCALPATPNWFIDLCLKRMPLPPDALRLGRNELVLTTCLAEDTQLEAVYLLGAFGVRSGEIPVLAALPERLAVGDITDQGLPHYGGAVTYLLPPPKAAATLEIPSFSGACLKLRSDLEDPGRILGFSPYVVPVAPSTESLRLDVFLTRQNMFGPLHRLPLRQTFTGPESFRTTGAAWSDAPRLYPSGLLAAPSYRIGL